MSANPRTALAWLLSVALMAICSPALAAGHGGGGFHGGGAAFHGGAGFHSGFSNGGNFGNHATFHSGNIGHAWNAGTPHIASRPAITGNIHTGSFAAHSGNWNHAGNWNWNHGGTYWRHPRFDWDDWWRYGYLRPGISIGWGPGYYTYGYGYPYYGDNYYDYSYDVAPYTVYSPESVETQSPIEAETPAPANGEANDFQSQALEAFRQGDYRNAVRLATHAIVDNPKDQQAHLLSSLGLFAVGQYRGAAMEAHAAAALGPMPDWQTLIGIYNNNVDAYTKQLRALEKFVRNNKTKPEGRFLLGFQYIIDGHRGVARDQLLQALQMTPRDNVAAQLLTKAGGTIPAKIANELEQARHQAPPSALGPNMTK